MATHSSIPAWRIPWTKEPGGLQSIRSPTVRYDGSDLSAAARSQSLGKMEMDKWAEMDGYKAGESWKQSER